MFTRFFRPGRHLPPSRGGWRQAVSCVLLLTLAACRGGGPVAGVPTAALVEGTTSADTHIRISGLSAEELQSIRAWSDTARWQALIRVNVLGNDLAPVAGRYGVDDAAVIFRPAFPFEAGRTYAVRIDLTQLPQPRAGTPTTTSLSVAGKVRGPATTVTHVFPSADVWPENMLRFYIHFSAPMSRGQGTKYVHLQDAQGAEIPDAILAAYAELWNPEQTRLTVFFDPGRVKRGVGPNVAMGRAIVAGLSYRIVVDREWPDADGQPLVAGFTHSFKAGPSAYRALSVQDWRLTPPAAGSASALMLVFPAPLDRALLDRTIGVETVDGRAVPGTVTIEPGDVRWRFTPTAPWTSGAYQLVISTVLEDPAGNKVGRAFEVLSSSPDASQPDAETVRRPFTIG